MTFGRSNSPRVVAGPETITARNGTQSDFQYILGSREGKNIVVACEVGVEPDYKVTQPLPLAEVADPNDSLVVQAAVEKVRKALQNFPSFGMMGGRRSL